MNNSFSKKHCDVLLVCYVKMVTNNVNVFIIVFLCKLKFVQLQFQMFVNGNRKVLIVSGIVVRWRCLGVSK